MIYDNYDNPKLPGNTDTAAVDIRRFLPDCDHESVIITTRWSQVTIGTRIRVEKLENIQDGIQILSTTSGRTDIAEGKILEIQGVPFKILTRTDYFAVALAKELDGLPLALSTAGAYLEQVTTTFSEYLRLYKESWLMLQMTTPQLNSYEDRSLYTTWHLSLNQIEQRNVLSAKLLKLWAYFDRQDVWFELLHHGSLEEEEDEEGEREGCDDYNWVRELIGDRLNFNEAVRVLCNYGLVDPDLSLNQNKSGYSMHSCVHSWTVSVLNREWDERLARLALTCVASVVPSDTDQDWSVLQRRLLHHAATCTRLVMEGKVKTEGMGWALDSLGLLYRGQGKLDEAEEMYIRVMQGDALNPDHNVTLSSVNNLGLLYIDQGKLDEAEKMLIQALQGREKTWGPDHTLTLSTVNNLGLLYSDQGKLNEAEKMYNRALNGKEKTLGPDHTSTLSTVNNLGGLYRDQGKLDEAETMLIRVLHRREKILGPDHTLTLTSLGNLGLLRKDRGELATAEKMLARVLRGFEEALGRNHPLVLQTLNNLGYVYLNQNKLYDAEKMFQQALQETKNLEYESAMGAFRGLFRIYRQHSLSLWREHAANNQADLAVQFRETIVGLATICEKYGVFKPSFFGILKTMSLTAPFLEI